MVLLEENADSICANAGNITFQQFAEKWLNEYEVDQLKKKTFHDYKVALETKIFPEIGKVKLSRITPQFLVSFYKKLLTGDAGKRKYEAKPDLLKYMKSQKITRVSVSEGSGLAIGTVSKAVKCIRIDENSAQKICDYLQLDMNKYFNLVSGKKALAPASISKYHRIISSMMTAAVQWQYIDSNPCFKVKPPKVKRKEAVYLDQEEIIELLECLKTEEPVYQTLISLFIYTGMRRGEAVGLTWKDIDFEHSLIDINKERIYIPGKGVYEDDPKTEGSKRTIKVPMTLMNMLRDWKEEQQAIRIRFGDQYFVSDFVFTWIDGNPLHPDTVSKWFRDFIDKNGLPKVHIHSLRHTNASILIANGVDIKTVSKRLGHANIQTTGNIYTHQIRSADELASETIELVLGSKPTKETDKQE